MNRSFFKYLLVGIAFVGTQEFWVTVIWRGNVFGFILAVLITQVLFLTFTYFCGEVIERGLKRTGLVEPVAYGVFGLVGLGVIEWYFVGNVPGSEASQIVMFSTWGGCVVMARIFTDNDVHLQKLKTAILWVFVPFAVLFTLLGLLLPTYELRFTVTYLAANFGYLAFNIFYIIFFIKKFIAVRISIS